MAPGDGCDVVMTRTDEARARSVRSALLAAVARADIRKVVTFAGCEVGYRGNHPPAIAWAEDYLGAYLRFSADERSHAAPTASGLVDPTLHRALLDALDGAVGEPSRTHASSVLRPGPRWDWRRSDRFRLDPGLTVHVDADTGAITVSDRTSGSFAFVTSEADADARLEPVRLIRELLTHQLERSGYVVEHAGAVLLEDVGILVCGPRGAGKTTLICALLEHEGARFISNDRIFVRGDASTVAWPWSIRVGLGTCSGSVALRGWLEPGRAFAHPQKSWDPAGGFDAAWRRRPVTLAGAGVNEDKVELTASELATVMAGGVCASAKLGLLVFPQLDPAAATPELARVGPEDAAELLRRERLGIVADVHSDWLDLGLESRRPDAPAADAELGRVADALPAVALRMRDARDAAAAVAQCALAENRLARRG